MGTIETKAYAKINLALDVTGVRDDGYHMVKMVMQTLSLHDRLFITETDDDRISVSTNLPFLPTGKANLVYLAASVFREKTGLTRGVHISLNKHIPVAAGLAGGSSDAAAVLKGMNTLFNTGLSNDELKDIALRLGADVPYCLIGGTVLCEGIGEELTPLRNAPYANVILVKPKVSVSTKHIYEKLELNENSDHPDVDSMIKAISDGNYVGVSSKVKNILEPVTASEYPEIKEIEQMLRENGADCAAMSGSGPTVFGLFTDREVAQKAFFKFKEDGKYARNVFLTGYKYNINL
ncbi:MAG: 4-(cytidine 5'-diphospho)-2-C-methyl-D-erythritol kinase [Lachnospiraceae bacterium]|jgi:4-diphosphocytidyl-2-C-methyl-D-erythritol kinase|nr:4-(cytidine 5'-diphospho)-2-C-methyl-D-erythritol kinase [Lachnospiraceae bacterium]